MKGHHDFVEEMHAATRDGFGIGNNHHGPEIILRHGLKLNDPTDCDSRSNKDRMTADARAKAVIDAVNEPSHPSPPLPTSGLSKIDQHAVMSYPIRRVDRAEGPQSLRSLILFACRCVDGSGLTLFLLNQLILWNLTHDQSREQNRRFHFDLVGVKL